MVKVYVLALHLLKISILYLKSWYNLAIATIVSIAFLFKINSCHIVDVTLYWFWLTPFLSILLHEAGHLIALPSRCIERVGVVDVESALSFKIRLDINCDLSSREHLVSIALSALLPLTIILFIYRNFFASLIVFIIDLFSVAEDVRGLEVFGNASG
ncbi:hypothetical protein [Desulfurococcus amylolyticus]|uniref:Uncharacterized protein n=1 Tax=Desulfurococcus amylolyticus DSM 16532 TaxID=768672 RepID=I3XTA3_DESAM|nr:hypothetical protein [Desulfurococcus amylolyticus]AFL67177.1 hypothetical protein Desfe_1309 [Desulfurococcus amylolyticus DSM 16532]